jgi:hypothetical protein
VGLKVWLVAGGLFGFIGGIPNPSAMLVWGVLYLIVGALIGTLLGGINGIVLGVATILFYTANVGLSNYKQVMTVISNSISFVAGAVLYWIVARYYSVTGEVDVGFIVIFAVISAAVGGFVGTRIANWYLKLRRSDERSTAV